MKSNNTESNSVEIKFNPVEILLFLSAVMMIVSLCCIVTAYMLKAVIQ